jgi:hypothetical protein
MSKIMIVILIHHHHKLIDLIDFMQRFRARQLVAMVTKFLYPQKLALTSPTSGGRSVGIVRSRAKATELVS